LCVQINNNFIRGRVHKDIRDLCIAINARESCCSQPSDNITRQVSVVSKRLILTA